MKKTIFIIIALLFIIGCEANKGKDMTISVPTNLSLISTSVTDDTPVFDIETFWEEEDIVRKDDAIYSLQGEALILFNGGIDLNLDDVFQSDSTLYKVIKEYIDESPNAENSVIDGRQDYRKDISGFPATNFYTIGPTDTVTFTQISGTLWNKVTTGTGGYSMEVTIHETWNPGYQDQEYFIFEGDLYRRTITHNSVGNTRYYNTTTEYMEPIFIYREPINGLKPFDSKQYTKAEATSTMTYTIKGLVKFDTLALGHIKADTIDVTFKDSLGVVIGDPIIGKVINSERDPSGNLEKWHTTDISYSDEVMEINSTVEIVLYGAELELGTILLGMSIDAGFTKLLLSNGYIDYSTAEPDRFGFIDYVERAKVAVYDGLVDIRISDYDIIDRLMISLGAQLVILNGSDAKNQTPNGQSIFASTQKIGRLFNFKQKTKLNGKQMHQMATYSFTLKEIV